MTVAEKSTLCTAALLWGGCVAFMGLGFSAMAEPDEFDVSTRLFWIFLGIAFAVPFWLPVFVSRSSSHIAAVIRLGSIIFMLLIAVVAVHQLYFDVNRSVRGHEVSLTELTIGALIAFFSVICAAFVFRSDRSLRKNDT